MRFIEFFVEEFQPKPATFADGTLRLSKHLQDRSRERDIPMSNIMQAVQRLEAVRGKDLIALPPTSFIVKTPNNFEMAIIKTQSLTTKKVEYIVATVRKTLRPGAGQRIIYLEDELDEGWKSALAGAAATGAMAFGGAADAKPAPTNKPVVTAKAQTKVAPKPAHVAVSKADQAKMTPIQKLKTAASANGIHGTELAQFLAQCAHESANFKNMEEIGSPAYFAKKYDPKYAPKTARILGNTQIGDGERYKGRGFIQLTGRDNYKRAGQALNLPLEANPDLAARPDVAAVVAVWYWKNRVANKVKNFNNTKQATKAINPAMKGIADRQEKFKQYQVAMR